MKCYCISIELRAIVGVAGGAEGAVVGGLKSADWSQMEIRCSQGVGNQHAWMVVSILAPKVPSTYAVESRNGLSRCLRDSSGWEKQASSRTVQAPVQMGAPKTDESEEEKQ